VIAAAFSRHQGDHIMHTPNPVPGHGSLHAGRDLSRRTALGRLGAAVAASLGLAATGARAAAQDSTPMTEAATPVFLVDWLAVWAEDPSQADSVYTGDAVLEDVGGGAVYSGREEIRDHVAAEFAAFPDHTYEVRSAFRAGDWAAAEGTPSA
jgi:hypothetical protein